MNEYFAVNISKEQLKEFTEKDTDLAFYGQSYTRIYKIPKEVATAFYKEIIK